MKLFIDSSQKVFAVALFDENNQILRDKIVDTKYKVEEILNFFENIIEINDIEEIYLNLGPGSFTGTRVSLLYVRTLAQIKSTIKIFVTNTFLILKKFFKNNFLKNKFYINASKSKSYKITKNKIQMVKKTKKEILIDYQWLFDNFSKIIDIFWEENVSKLTPIYGAEPNIGELKK